MLLTLGDLIDRGVAVLQTGPFGSQLHKSDYVERGIPVVPTEAIGWRKLETTVMPQISEQTAERLARHRVLAGDILFARRGIQATGLSAIVEPPHEGFICGTGALRLRLNGYAVRGSARRRRSCTARFWNWTIDAGHGAPCPKGKISFSSYISTTFNARLSWILPGVCDGNNKSRTTSRRLPVLPDCHAAICYCRSLRRTGQIAFSIAGTTKSRVSEARHAARLPPAASAER